MLNVKVNKIKQGRDASIVFLPSLTGETPYGDLIKELNQKGHLASMYWCQASSFTHNDYKELLLHFINGESLQQIITKNNLAVVLPNRVDISIFIELLATQIMDTIPAEDLIHLVGWSYGGLIAALCQRYLARQGRKSICYAIDTNLELMPPGISKQNWLTLMRQLTTKLAGQFQAQLIYPEYLQATIVVERDFYEYRQFVVDIFDQSQIQFVNYDKDQAMVFLNYWLISRYFCLSNCQFDYKALAGDTFLLTCDGNDHAWDRYTTIKGRWTLPGNHFSLLSTHAKRLADILHSAIFQREWAVQSANSEQEFKIKLQALLMLLSQIEPLDDEALRQSLLGVLHTIDSEKSVHALEKLLRTMRQQ